MNFTLLGNEELSIFRMPCISLSADCGIIASKVQLNLDDLLWVLTDSQLKAAILFANSLREVVNKSAQQSKLMAAEKLQVRSVPPILRTAWNHFVHTPSQWETTLHCNVVSHWLGACTARSLGPSQNCLWVAYTVINAWTKWLTFCRWHLQVHFLHWRVSILFKISL